MAEKYLNLAGLTTYDGKIKDYIDAQDATLTGQVNALDARLDTAEGDITTLEGQMSSANSNIAANARDIDTLQGQVASLNALGRFLGKFESLESVTNPHNGDMVIVGNKEYIYCIPTGETNGFWEELGDVDALGNRVGTLETEMDAVQGVAGSAVQNGSGVAGTNTTTTVTKEGTNLKVKVNVTGASTIGTSETATTLPTTGAVVKAINALDSNSSDSGSVSSIVTSVAQTNGKVTVEQTGFAAITNDEIAALF